MTDGRGGPPQGPMHEASVLIRRILVLNENMEFMMRREMEVNETDFQAMQHLMKARSMTPTQLAQLLHLTPAATTTVIDRLVGKGHVTRAPHPTDRRRWVITPSRESVKFAMEKLMPMILDVDDSVRGFSHEHQEAIVHFLNSVVASMDKRAAALDTDWRGKDVRIEPTTTKGEK